MYLDKEQAISAVNAFNGIGKSEGIPYKDHLLGCWGYCLTTEESGNKHLWSSLLAGPLADITEEGAKELMTKIYDFFDCDENGKSRNEHPYNIPDTDARLIEVGLIESF